MTLTHLAFITRWAIGTALGGVTGALVAIAVMLPAAAIHPFIGTMALGVALGGGLALGQWLVLGQRQRGTGWWIPLGVLGASAGLFAGVALAPGGGVIQGALFGAGLGIAQGLALRRVTRGAGWWVVTSVVGWGLAWGLGGGLAGEWGALGFALQTLPYSIGTGLIQALLAIVPGTQMPRAHEHKAADDGGLR